MPNPLAETLTEPLTSGRFALSAIGSIFSGDVSLDLRNSALFRREGDVTINDNSTTVICIDIGDERAADEAAPGPQQRATAPRDAGLPALAAPLPLGTDADAGTNADTSAAPPPAPFTLKTTLLFDDPRVAQMRRFQLAGMHVIVMGTDPRHAAVPGYDRFNLVQKSGQLALAPCPIWRRHRGPKTAAIPVLPKPGLLEAPGSRNAGELKSDNRILSLHRLPLDTPLMLGGQETVFCAPAIRDACVAIVQTLSRGTRYASTPAVILLPNPM